MQPIMQFVGAKARHESALAAFNWDSRVVLTLDLGG